MSQWKMVKLGDVSSVITKGTTPTTLGFAFQVQGINFIKIESISENGEFLKEKFKHISQECDDKLRRSRLCIDDILFSIAGALGRTAIVTEDVLPANINQALAIIRIKKEKIYHPYIQYTLKSDYVYQQFQKQKQGVAQLNLSLKNISELTIPLPPIEIQQKIAKTLDTASDLLKLCKQQLAELDQLIQSVFYELFGDPMRNEKGWNKLKLEDRCTIITGNTPPRKEKENYGDFIEWIKSDNINTSCSLLTTAVEYLSVNGFEKGRYVEKGSILMTCIAGSKKCIGNIGIANRRVAFNQQINGIVPKDDTLEFTYWMLYYSKPYIQSSINMALKGILSKGQLSNLEFIFPPISNQTKFASIVKKIEEQKSLVQQSIDKTQTLFDSLMNQFFE